MGKYIVEGKVGVLFSPGPGIPFSAWGNPKMAIDGDLVDAFISEDDAEFRHLLIHKYGSPSVDMNVEIAWIEIGTRFLITERNGSEEILIIDDSNSYVA